jgi:hypothetical protein
VAAWLGGLRSCFVSGNLPSAPNFAPADLAANFLAFYLSFLPRPRRAQLWSLYGEDSVLAVGDSEVVGRAAIMAKLDEIQARPPACKGRFAPEEAALHQPAARPAPATPRSRRPLLTRARVRGGGAQVRVDVLATDWQQAAVWGPPPPSRTKWTRRVPHPVLIGHAASLTPY